MSKKKQLVAGTVSALMALQPLAVLAAPGTLSQDPLFVGTNVQPNILFVVDDSGSMGSDVLLTREAQVAHPPDPDNPDRLLDFSPNDFNDDREHCVGYNVMAYNPDVTYVPWSGNDDAGNPYDNQSISSALTNPYAASGGTKNLLDITAGFSAVYGAWVDADTDGTYDAGECPTGAADDGNDYADRAPDFTDSRWVFVDTLSADKQTNYANWYTYYRKREYVVKRALSEIIDQSTARLGMATLNNNAVGQFTDTDGDGDVDTYIAPGVGVGTAIRDVDNITVPLDTTAQTNKQWLMQNLFRIHSRFGTPLRRSLERAGNYFEESVTTDVSSLFGFTPAEDAQTLTGSPIFTDTNGGSCQKNFTVLLSDGVWNFGDPSVGNTDGPGNGNTSFDGGSYADDFSNTLADVAMDYYERDLAPGLPDDVTASTGDNPDNNPAQHMVTYTIAFGVNGTLTANPTDTTTAFNWPDPMEALFDDDSNPTGILEAERDARRIDDLRHAAWNGRGEFLSAADPQELITSLNDALDDIESRVSSAASVSFNSTSLDNGALLFRAEFNPAGWSGDIQALTVTSSGVSGSQWSAASGLNGSGVTADNRDIITYNGNQGVPFRWPADYTAPTSTDISAAQINDLIFGITDPSAQDDFGADMLDFIRGDHSQELQQTDDIRQFRNRLDNRLGDVVHSAPVFAGTPNARYPDNIAGDSNLYSQFILNNASRRELIYVGANDGMLHSFDANDGDEIFAYIPGFLFASGSQQEGLHYLADDDYAHRSYVDLTPTTGDVFVDGAWRTYLAGGARAGGQGVFVLDITSPSALNNAENNADNIVVREFSSTGTGNAGDPDLGFTYSRISIAKMNNDRWAAIFGNGYNNTGDGTAKIFILYLDSSGGYVELETNAGSIANGSCSDGSSNCNGMSTPEVLDLDNDGTADRIYAGDLLGNMWAFDISDDNATNWGSDYGTSAVPVPLFAATDSSGNAQPITSKPSVDVHSRRNLRATSPNLLVTFGTGQYVTDNDPSTTTQQTFYGIWDSGSAINRVGSGSLDRDRLVTQTITQTTIDGTIVRQNSSNSVNYNITTPGITPEMGWKIDFLTPGERNVVDPVVLGPIVFFNTLIPESAQCAFGGSGFLMNVDLLTGGQPAFPVIDLPDNSGTYSGIESLGVPTAPKFVSNRGTDRDATRYVNTSRGIEAGDISLGSDSGSSGRTSWTNLTR